MNSPTRIETLVYGTQVQIAQQEDRESFISIGIGGGMMHGCFACMLDDYVDDSMVAFAIDMRSALRICVMFSPQGVFSCQNDYPKPGGWIIKIGAYEKHMPNLRKLHELVSDGFISRERVIRARNAVSQQEFERIVRCQAFINYQVRNDRNSVRNWVEAIGALQKELGRFPKNDEITARARKLWEERKAEQAAEDWYDAERFARRHWEIAV